MVDLAARKVIMERLKANATIFVTHHEKSTEDLYDLIISIEHAINKLSIIRNDGSYVGLRIHINLLNAERTIK